MTPKKITDQLEQTVGYSGRPRQLRDAIEHVLLDRFGQPATEAAEVSENLCEKVAEEIETRFGKSLEIGTVAPVSLRLNHTVIHGSLFVFPDDPPSDILSKQIRIKSEDLFFAMRSLDFDQFEKFCGAVLREMGCPSPVVTSRSTDQGIDFFGETTIGGLLGEHIHRKRLLHSARTVILGQAKHYPNRKIGPKEVRELIGALTLARTSSFSKPDLDLFDKADLRPNTPTLAVLFSTGDFTAGARHLADEAGIVLYSGIQLAVFLADCQVGIRIDGEIYAFDNSDFRTWMSSQN